MKNRKALIIFRDEEIKDFADLKDYLYNKDKKGEKISLNAFVKSAIKEKLERDIII